MKSSDEEVNTENAKIPVVAFCSVVSMVTAGATVEFQAKTTRQECNIGHGRSWGKALWSPGTFIQSENPYIVMYSVHYYGTLTLTRNKSISIDIRETIKICHLYSASSAMHHFWGGQLSWITQLLHSKYTTPALTRKRSPDGATTYRSHLIAACYSLIDPRGWKAELT